MITKARLLLLTALFSAVLVTGNAHAQSRLEAPIFFDDFLFDNDGQPREGLNQFNLWTVTSGTVDLVGLSISQFEGNPAFDRFVDLGGSTGRPGRFATRVPLPFLANAAYRLSFNFKSTDGNPATARVSVGDYSWDVRTSSTNFEVFNADFSFAAETYASIVFQDLGPNDNSGLGIDAIVVTRALILPTVSPSNFGGPDPLEIRMGVTDLNEVTP